MYTLLVILMCVVAVLMILIVLMQESKGGGLSSSFSSYNQIAGVQQTTNIVEKLTWGFAVALVILSFFCARFAPDATSNSTVIDKVELNNQNNVSGFETSETIEAENAATSTEATQQ